MEEIRKQVARARTRLILQQFLGIVTWSLFAGLLCATIGLVIPRIWPLAIDRQTWDVGWAVGGLAVGVLIAVVWTFLVRKAAIDAAIEIDRRFGLKERVSSALALPPSDAESAFGRALLEDAARRVARIDIRDQFQVSLSRRSLWLCVPALATFAVIWFVPFAETKQVTAASNTAAETKKQVQRATEELKKRVEQQRLQAEEKGLKEAETIFKKLNEGLDQLKDSNQLDRKEALVKLNNLAEELAKRRDELGSAKDLKSQLNQLRNLQQGPADKMVNAMKQGDFGKALDQLNTLKDKIQKGEMTEAERKQMAKQLAELQQKLQQMAEEQKQAKRELAEQIKQKQAEGDLAAATKLQQQLDKLNKMDSQMNRIEQMAQQLGETAKSMESGDPNSAAQQLSQLGSELKKMQADFQELESIDSVLDQIADAKDSMNCEECEGSGCPNCQGREGSMKNRPSRSDNAQGKGRGAGDRPEEETDTSFYESKVGAKTRPGQAVRSGSLAGPNRTGVSQQEIQQQIIDEVSKQSDPLTEQRLPKSQRQHTNQYMKLLREGT